MDKYNPVTPELLEELAKVVGAANVKTDADTLDRFKTDEETDPRLMHLPEVVVCKNIQKNYTKKIFTTQIITMV